MKNIKLLALMVLTLAVALLALTSCDAVKDFAGNIFGNSADDHVHSFSEATCTAPKTCECGATEGEPLGHTYVDGKCACGAEDPDYVPHEHSYTAVVTKPTCTEDGYTTYTCTCGDSYVDDEVKAEGHKYESVVTEPTCTEDGYTTYTCGCGDSYTDDEVDALGHTLNGTICETCNGVLTAMNPVADKGYLFGMTQKNVQNTVYYLKGGMSGYYMATTSDPAQALLIYLEETEGGYYAYCFVNDTKTYINMVVSGTHVNGAYEATASTVYTIDEDHHTIIAVVNNANYWFGTRNDNTYTTAGPCATSYNGFYCEFYDVHHHDFKQGETVAPDCENNGYTEYNCACGATEQRDPVNALNHIEGEWETVKDASCTEEGQKAIKCQREGCGATLQTEVIAMIDHVYVDGVCGCGKEDPSIHQHSYTAVVTAPTCTATGYTTYTCGCGDSYTGDETEMVPHVDENLDITCDYDGCSKRILPPADSKVSLFTANHMIIVSLNSSYYVEGVITEITDAKNGVFIIEDEAGDSILIRLPKNADGVSYASWTDVKVVVGDTVQVYGKPVKNINAPATEQAKVEGGTLTIIKHEHSFSEATCDKDSVCACLAVGATALGHIDEDNNNVCDRCPWKMNMAISNIVIATDTTLANGSQTLGDDNKATAWTWSDNNFDVVIAKGTSTYTLYTSAKAYMQLKKGNSFTVTSKNSLAMTSITINTTNATQLTNLKNAIGTAYEYTVDEANLTVTIALNSATSFSFSHVGSTTAYISGVSIVYEK